MAELKTKPNMISVSEFLHTVDESKKAETLELIKMMEQATGSPAVMWGTSIIGFGDQRYDYESGHGGDWFIVGFSPRKAKFSIYLTSGFSHHQKLFEKLGKYKTGKSCIYINKLSDINVDILRQIIEAGVKRVQS